MQNTTCSSCGSAIRPGARFCPRCGAAASALGPAVQPVAPAIPQYAPQYPISQAPASAVVAPPSALLQLNSMATRGCGTVAHAVARLVTHGGRAAFTDLVAPDIAASGLVVSAPTLHTTPAPIEVGCFLWALAWLLGGGLLLLMRGRDWWVTAAIILTLYLILFALSWTGLRRPYFSRLTLKTLLNLVTGQGRGTEPQMEFALNTQQG